MSINELQQGRRVNRIVFPDDQYLGDDDDKIEGMWVVEVPGNGAMVPWIKVIFKDGTNYIVNAAHLAMVIINPPEPVSAPA